MTHASAVANQRTAPKPIESFAVPAVGLRELAAASLLGWSNYQLGRYLGRESHAVLRGKVFTVHRGVRFCGTSVPGNMEGWLIYDTEINHPFFVPFL